MAKCLCIFVTLFVTFFVPLGSSQGATITKIIDSGYHHLGDNAVSWMHHPDPDGVAWRKSFSLPSFSSPTATIQIIVAGIDGADMVINGNRIAIPITSVQAFATIYRTHSITFPASFLKPGAVNVIRIESLGEVGNKDDFEFIKVTLYIH